MILVAAFCRKVQHVRRICHFSAEPVGYLLSEPALNLRIIPPLVCFAKISQACVSPISHGNHHLVLKHFEMPRLVKLQAALPCVTEPVRPLSRVTIAFVPDVLLGPKPALLPESENQLQNIDMPLTILGFFFDVQDKSAGRFQYAVKLLAPS